MEAVRTSAAAADQPEVNPSQVECLVNDLERYRVGRVVLFTEGWTSEADPWWAADGRADGGADAAAEGDRTEPREELRITLDAEDALELTVREVSPGVFMNGYLDPKKGRGRLCLRDMNLDAQGAVARIDEAARLLFRRYVGLRYSYSRRAFGHFDLYQVPLSFRAAAATAAGIPVGIPRGAALEGV